MATDDSEGQPQLDPLPEDWDRALAIVAHPDDMEYGAAAAVARWTAAEKSVAYVLVTRGEAGISTLAPEQCAPLRAEEQRRSCAAVGAGPSLAASVGLHTGFSVYSNSGTQRYSGPGTSGQ